MRHLSTEVLVIGGGATGTGVLRDLAMRGFDCVLVERGDLAHGTTGRYHGLLHSGGRYVVKDPVAARECIQENLILRKIMPFCIEDTGGFFVTTPWDDPLYAEQFYTGCQAAGIQVEEIPVGLMMKEEPLLNPQITRCFRVPDASADSFLAAEANVLAALRYGAVCLTYHQVRQLTTANDRITGAICYNLVNEEDIQIQADFVVNASGAWAGKIAASADLDIQIKPGKGTMVAMNHRILNTVVNRCKMPADGDIIVPAHTVAVIGTTDQQVPDPDSYAIEPWEIQLMLDEGEKLVPSLRDMRMLRAWAGVRPLYQESNSLEKGDSRDITRAYVLLDHESRDGKAGMVSITSGKWTTYRKMAEATTDLVCQKLGERKPCRTHLESLPSPEETSHSGYHWLGARLESIEKSKSYGKIICECELVSEAEIIHSIMELRAKSIDDIRRDTRLGMGPCQGGFCTFRAAGMLHQKRDLPVTETNAALKDFLQERWKGLLPVLWGQQLRQERLDELIYLNVLNIPDLPGPQKSRLASEPYASEKLDPSKTNLVQSDVQKRSSTTPIPPPRLDTLVIGAGLAGLFTTLSLVKAGLKVRCISKGWGAQFWTSGCIDILRCEPSETVVGCIPLRPSLEKFIQANPAHPYAICGLEQLDRSISFFQSVCEQKGYPMHAADPTDALGENWLLPTTAGSLRQTCLAPQTMVAGDCRRMHPGKMMLLVGFAGFPDFNPELAAANLRQQGFHAQGILLSLPSLADRRFITGRSLAQCFESSAFRQEFTSALEPYVTNLNVKYQEILIGLPAVLGLQPSLKIWQDLQSLSGCPVFEIPGLPPSTSGIRLHQVLIEAIREMGGQVFDGMQVVQADMDGKRILSVASESAARLKKHSASEFVLATGGILGGGFTLEPPAADQTVRMNETIFNIPLHFNSEQVTISRSNLFSQQFLDPRGHKLYLAGLKVQSDLRPVDFNSEVYLSNLTAVGNVLTGTDPIREYSLEGIALVTASTAAKNLVKPVAKTS